MGSFFREKAQAFSETWTAISRTVVHRGTPSAIFPSSSSHSRIIRSHKFFHSGASNENSLGQYLKHRSPYRDGLLYYFLPFVFLLLLSLRSLSCFSCGLIAFGLQLRSRIKRCPCLDWIVIEMFLKIGRQVS